jgi:hypothetical protein
MTPHVEVLPAPGIEWPALGWGLRHSIVHPDRVLAVVGARLFATRNGLEWPGDRCEWHGDPRHKKLLGQWLGLKRDGLPWKRHFEPSSTVIESKDKGRMHMRFTPNASYGYLYLTAWIDLK